MNSLGPIMRGPRRALSLLFWPIMEWRAEFLAYFFETNVKKYACMKKCEQGIDAAASSVGNSSCGVSSPLKNVRFEIGDVYLFHKRNSHCPPESSLWGVFDVPILSSIWNRARQTSVISLRGIVFRKGIVIAVAPPGANSGIISLTGRFRKFSSCRDAGVSESGSIVPGKGVSGKDGTADVPDVLLRCGYGCRG